MVLNALAVAGRPLREDLLGDITGLEPRWCGGGCGSWRRPGCSRTTTVGGAYRPRHALLAEAVAGGLLPGERAVLHERTARALGAAGDEALAGEAAGHWQAAGRPAGELPARVAAAAAAEQIFGYAEAAGHWQRAIELCHGGAGRRVAPAPMMPRLYLRAIEALEISGAGERAGVLAEEAYRRFAGHPDPAIAAVIHLRVAVFAGCEAPAAGLPLIREALRLFEQAPPSADHAEAWLRYAHMFVFHAEGRHEPTRAALTRALEIAETAGATALISRILVVADRRFVLPRADRGGVRHPCTEAAPWREAAGDGEALLRLAVTESDALLTMGKSQTAAEVGLRGLGPPAKAASRPALMPACWPLTPPRRW